VLLHMAKTLPRYITAAAAAAGDPGASALVAVFGGLSAADAAAGSARIADPASLGKLKRDLFFRWGRCLVLIPWIVNAVGCCRSHGL
jgi:hypothetical protein